MNVRELIAELEKIEDKELPVKWVDRYGMGGDCCSNEEYHYHYDYNESSLEDVTGAFESTNRVAQMKNGKIVYHDESVVVVGDW